MECEDYLYILGQKKKKSWEVIEKEEVKSPANERGNMFSPEFRISMETCVGWLCGITALCIIHLY